MPDIEIKRGYEVLPDNNIRFGIRVINNSDAAISDVEVILDYSESLFELEGSKIHKLGTIPPTVPRTAEFILKPLGCIHQENIGATILYKDHAWTKHTEEMHPKEVHCVCPFLKKKNITKSEFLNLSSSGHASETGLNFDGVGVKQVVSFLLQTCKGRYYKVDEVSVEGGKILYLASESIGDKAHYLLTALIRENEGLTQVMLRAVSDKQHGLNGFLNEVVEEIRHIVSTVNSAHEIGFIKQGQVINIIDSVVQRTSFGGGEGAASVNIKDSVVQRSGFKGADEQNKLEEERILQRQREEERSQRKREEKEGLSREETKSKGTPLRKIITIILLLSILLFLYNMFDVGSTKSQEILLKEETPTIAPTPEYVQKITPTAIVTPKVTQTPKSLQFFEINIPIISDSTSNYVGSEQCGLCHSGIYNQWQKSTHTDTKPIITCELCHGYGSQHVEKGGGRTGKINNPPELCYACHQKDNQIGLDIHSLTIRRR